MDTARQMQSRMKEAQEAGARVQVEGNAGGGMVVAQANGKGEILRINIEPTLVEMGDKGMIEDLVTAAVNQALARGREAMQEEMKKVTGGMPVPFDLSNLNLGG